MIRTKFISILFVSALITALSSMPVQASNWIAPVTDNDLNNPANWDPNAVPGSSDVAVFSPGYNTNPVENSAPFSVSSFSFPSGASLFNFNFNNESLTFNGTGITGSSTNPTITVTNTNNSSFPGDLISFLGGTGTSGSAIITSSNSGTLTGSHSSTSLGSFNSNLHSTGAFTVSNGGSLTASNTGNDSTSGTGNNGTANTGSSQLRFDQSFTAGNNVVVSASNSGTFSGNNTAQGDAVAIVNGSQFISSGAFQVGDNFNCQIQNTGNDSSPGFGLSNVGQLNAAQMILQTTAMIGNNCTIDLSNTGNNSSQTISFPDFLGYLNDQQFFVGSTFQAGDGFNLAVTNTGIDSSNGHGGYQVAVINSNSGTTGNQILFLQGGTLGNQATIGATNNGTYSGANTSGGSNVSGMNLQQIAIGDSTAPGSYAFVAGNYFSLNASNSGLDSSHGAGANAVGDVSTDQVTFFAPVTLGTNANITISNGGNFSGHASATYVNVGSAGGSQLDCVSSFAVGDNFTLDVTNSGTNTGSGIGGYFIGDLITGQQVNFQNSLIIGNNATITLSNSGSNSSNTTNNSQIGSFMGYGKQLRANNLFQVGNDFILRITNSGFDDSTGPGGNFVGFMNNNTVDHSASQVHLANGGTIGDRASITLSNTGTYQGSNTTSGNSIGVLAGQQLYSVGDFHAGNNFGLTVSNSGIDNASAQNNNSMGTLNSSQVQFGGACVLGNNTTIALTNSGTNNDTTGTFNNIGVIGGFQMLVTGDFTAGTGLNLSATNETVVQGDSSNFVGVVSGSQIAFAQNCTLNDGSTISAYNYGTVNQSQIVFLDGLDLISGQATIQAINHGTLGQFGINIQGGSVGGNIHFVLVNSSINIATTGPFTVAGLNGGSSSVIQSQGLIIVNTGPGVNAIFAGVIQNSPFGIGSLTKAGFGTQTLSGYNTYTGLTTIQEGILIVNGTISGSMVIDSLGILKGNGTILGDVSNNGTISPGESIGLLTIGSLTNTGDYDVEVSSTDSDLIVVNEGVTLNGGTVIVSSVDGTYKFQQPYEILTSESLTGTFANSIAVSPTLGTSLDYHDNNVYLTLVTAFENVARSSNQRNVAVRLDDIIGPNANQTALFSALVNLSVEDAQEALVSLSGYQHTEDLWSLQILNRQFIRRLYDPIRSIVTTDPSCNCQPCVDQSLYSWLEVEGAFFNVRGNHDANSFRADGFNVAMGVQQTFCESLTGGLAGAYEYDHLHYHHGGSGQNITWLGGLYGLYRPEGYYALADFTFGYSTNRIDRGILVGPLRYNAHSKPKVNEFTFYGEWGFDYWAEGLLIQPFVGFQASRFFRHHLTETEAHGWALVIDKKDSLITQSRLGIHMSTANQFKCVEFSLDLAWNALLSSQGNHIRGSFVDFGTSYDIKGIPLSDSVDYALTASTNICADLSAYLEFSGETWTHATTYDVVGGIKWFW